MRGISSVQAAVLLASSFGSVQAGRNVEGQIITSLGQDVPIDEPKQFWSQLHHCPLPCGDNKPANWTVYSSLQEVSTCDEPMLFDLNIYNPVSRGHAIRIRACTASDKKEKSINTEGAPAKDVFKPSEKRADQLACLGQTNKTSQTVKLSRFGTSSPNNDHIFETLASLSKQFSHAENCKLDNSILLAYTNGTIAGAYTGPAVAKSGVASWIKSITDNVKSQGPSQRMISQICGEGRNSQHVMGISIDTSGNLTAVQNDLKNWADGKCATVGGKAASLAKLELVETKIAAAVNSTASGNSTLHHLSIRGDCRVISVNGGDSCGSLASRCGISGADFTKYNPGKDFCSKLQPEQRVCCSAGTVPDIRPKPNKDGSCHVQYVANGDNCAKYAAKYGMTTKEIDALNDKKTWGWTGCDALFAGINICLSKGDPPMPAPISNAVCGPTKPGSKRPTDGTKLEDINPCPLNACCNIWGQCGINGDFCTVKPGPRGNPGTSAEGFDGCVSSCGQDIVNHANAPPSFDRVGYYESWNFDRSCLNLRAGNANTDGSYTIIHWAFANVKTGDWSVSINDTFNQWDTFKAMNGVKKVVSFGGWGYSTDPATYDILREAMAPANRNTFATNVAAFVEKHKLDGVDFDWEYPGATDIDGTPPGQESDGPNYLKFLIVMKSKLGKGKTLSIAAPASYWYLKAFPIKMMAKQLDYIVYMTYDLHGQWDSGNKWSSEGCPQGNCLRSHVNMTETRSVLAMITKAGVETNKIFVGESSYGRSFKMSKAGCTGPMCTFLGDRYHSQAKKGRCTDTAGYISDAEINEIINHGDNVKTWYDKDSGSNIMVYDDTEWVAYLGKAAKLSRRLTWPFLNFRGTIDWAVDLQDFTKDGDFPLGEPTGDEGTDKIPDCKGSYTKLDDVPKDVEPYCKNLYILQALRAELQGEIDQYNDLLSDGYEKKFKTYAKAVARSGNKALEGFMWKHADDYFTCNVIEVAICCKACEYPGPVNDAVKKRCMFCEGGCGDWRPGCANGPHPRCGELDKKVKNITGPCPPDYSKRTDGPMQYDYDWAHSSVYWSLKGDKKNQFYADVLTNVGIEDKNIEFKDVERRQCLPPSTPHAECLQTDNDFGFPVTHDYDEDDVKNPEDVVKNAYKNITGIIPQLDTVIEQAQKKKYSGSLYDMVDIVSFMSQTVTDSVDAMQKIEDTVDKWDEEKRKNFIIAFLTAIFLFIPIVGEVVGAVAEMANIARIAALAGTVGNVALDVYDIVKDPDNAALAIFSLVLEPLGLLDVIKVSKAAARRRLMTPEELKKLHANPDSKIHKIDDIRNSCGKKKRGVAGELPVGVLPMSDANSGMSGVSVWPEY